MIPQRAAMCFSGRMKHTLPLLLLAASAVHAAPPPCSSAEHRQFDFWIGDWRVQTPDGKLAGINRITQEYGGCVIHEHYVTGKGYSGESLNTWDAARKVWHQTWVDNSGLLLTLEGGWDGKSMILQGLAPTPAGSMARQRITWTPNDDGSVRQLWEAADEKGAWSVVFDGRYTRK
jgi:hypothetical protein